MLSILKIILLSLSFLLSISISANTELAKKTFQAYYNKEFKKTRSLAFQYLKEAERVDSKNRILKVFFITENDLNHLDSILDRIYRTNLPKHASFYNLMFILLEKTVVAKNYKIGLKWGEIYSKEAQNYKKYNRGIYLYSSLFYSRNDLVKSREILSYISIKNPNSSFTKKIEILRIFLQEKDKANIRDSKKFLSQNYYANYSDFVLANLIQAYRKIGKDQKANKLKKRFQRDFPRSIFLENVQTL